MKESIKKLMDELIKEIGSASPSNKEVLSRTLLNLSQLYRECQTAKPGEIIFEPLP